MAINDMAEKKKKIIIIQKRKPENRFLEIIYSEIIGKESQEGNVKRLAQNNYTEAKE